MQLEVRINLILHATENENKVLESLENVFDVDQENFQIEQVPGHFNNPILLISSKLKKKNAQNFIKLFFSKMKKDDFEQVFENVEDYVTSAGLNLRIIFDTWSLWSIDCVSFAQTQPSPGQSAFAL